MSPKLLWWWMSFVDEKAPPGKRVLGVAIVQAYDQTGAMQACWDHECNPGGDIFGTPLREGVQIDPKWTYTLLSMDDVQKLAMP